MQVVDWVGWALPGYLPLPVVPLLPLGLFPIPGLNLPETQGAQLDSPPLYFARTRFVIPVSRQPRKFPPEFFDPLAHSAMPDSERSLGLFEG